MTKRIPGCRMLALVGVVAASVWLPFFPGSAAAQGLDGSVGDGYAASSDNYAPGQSTESGPTTALTEIPGPGTIFNPTEITESSPTLSSFEEQCLVKEGNANVHC